VAGRKNSNGAAEQATESVWDEVLEPGDAEAGAPEDIEINLQRDSHDPMSIGTHLAVVQYRGTSDGPSGFPFITVRLECLDEDELGNEALDRISLSPAARFRLDNFLDAIGAPRSGSMKVSQFDGHKVVVAIDHEDYNGETRARPVRYMRADVDFAGASGGQEEPEAAEFK
jgi:hypothetical protein